MCIGGTARGCQLHPPPSTCTPALSHLKLRPDDLKWSSAFGGAPDAPLRPLCKEGSSFTSSYWRRSRILVVLMKVSPLHTLPGVKRCQAGRASQDASQIPVSTVTGNWPSRSPGLVVNTRMLECTSVTFPFSIVIVSILGGPVTTAPCPRNGASETNPSHPMDVGNCKYSLEYISCAVYRILAFDVARASCSKGY